LSALTVDQKKSVLSAIACTVVTTSKQPKKDAGPETGISAINFRR
jgi:hypothetical protein